MTSPGVDAQSVPRLHPWESQLASWGALVVRSPAHIERQVYFIALEESRTPEQPTGYWLSWRPFSRAGRLDWPGSLMREGVSPA